MNLMTIFLNILPDPPIGTPDVLAQGGIDFFGKWIARIGGLVAFIGAIKFALGIKSDDAREQIQAALIMISGFMISAAVQNLGIFNIPAVYTDAAAQAEFVSIMNFIGSWTRRVGALGLLIGSIMFGLSVKDNNAGSKVTALKTMSAGAIAASVSSILSWFVV